MIGFEEKTGTGLLELAEYSLKAAKKALKTSRVSSWNWATPQFAEAEDWLLTHPVQLHRGEYLSDTPGKAVWRLQLPEAFGGGDIIYRSRDAERMSFFDRIKESPALIEAVNNAALRSIGINVPDVLACGERRECCVSLSSFIITKYIPNHWDGSLLMPAGALHENDALREGFCSNLMESVARLHLAGFSIPYFHPKCILFPKDGYDRNPQLTWVDASVCRKEKGANMLKIIPRDLVRIFVDLRLSTNEIRKQCGIYLDNNTYCGHTPQSLWDAMVNLPIGG